MGGGSHSQPRGLVRAGATRQNEPDLPLENDYMTLRLLLLLLLLILLQAYHDSFVLYSWSLLITR